MSNPPIGFEEWKQDFCSHMRFRYCMSMEDLGLEEDDLRRWYGEGDTPGVVSAEQYAETYSLFPLDVVASLQSSHKPW